jgi:hypothetical protein
VRDVGGQEGPVARSEVDAVAVDIDRRAAGQDDDPLVVVLEIGLRGVVLTAEDLFDEEVAVLENGLKPLPGRRRRGPRKQGTGACRDRNG